MRNVKKDLLLVIPLAAAILVMGVVLTAQFTGHWTPANTNQSDLGQDATAFRDLFLVRDIFVEGTTADGNEVELEFGDPAADYAFNFTRNGGTIEPMRVISGTGATATLTALQSGSTVLLDRAAGITFTLPAPAVGLNYTFYVVTALTSNNYKFATGTQGTDFIVGSPISIDNDTGDAAVGFVCDGTTHDNFNMNGTTQGGEIGTVIKLTAISTTVWLAEGINIGSGTVATPCATS